MVLPSALGSAATAIGTHGSLWEAVSRSIPTRVRDLRPVLRLITSSGNPPGEMVIRMCVCPLEQRDGLGADLLGGGNETEEHAVRTFGSAISMPSRSTTR